MKSNLETSPLIFVGGAPRSGTTLVQRILGAHSAVYAGPEFDLVPEIMRLRELFLAGIDSGRISTYLDSQGVNAIFVNFVRSMFGKVLEESGKTHVSEKTPSNVAAFPELQDCMPHAHYIFVMRDPRSIVASMLEVGRRYRRDAKLPPGFVKNIRRSLDYINALWLAGNQARLKNVNILVVYYEDLVNTPRPIIEQMTNFLGIPFEEALLNIQDSVWDTSEFKSNENYWYTKEQLKTAIQADSMEKWHETLTPYELYVIDKHLIRIPGLTDRYRLDAPGSIFWALRDFIGASGNRLRKHLIRLYVGLARNPSLHRNASTTP